MNAQIVTTWQQGSVYMALAFQQNPPSLVLTEYNGTVSLAEYNLLSTDQAKRDALLNACLTEYNNQNGANLTVDDLNLE